MTPRFVPFAAMTDAEQREHLRRMHGYSWSSPALLAPRVVHNHDHDTHDRDWPTETAVTPHAHDKPAPEGTA